MSKGSQRVVQVGADDIERILDVEARSWPAELRATRETLLMRLERGHIFLAVEEDDRFLGMIRFSYTWFELARLDTLPPDFAAFSSLRPVEPFNAAFVYSLGVASTSRGGNVGHRLVFAMFDRAKRDGCVHVVGDGRVASYHGSEQVVADPAVKAAVDAHLAGAALDVDALLQDPLLALYRRAAGFEPICVMANYLPEDAASGGHRVMVHRDLTTWQGRNTVE